MKARLLKAGKFLAWGATTLGLVLITGMFWGSIFDPLIFNAKGYMRTDGFFPILSPILLKISMWLNFGWFKGLPMFFIGLAGLVFIYSRNSTKFAAFQVRPLTTTALALVIAAHAIVIAVSAHFFFVPAGAGIRPMGWAMFVIMVSFITFLLVAPISIAACFREKPRFLGIIALVGAFTSFPLSSFILHLAARIKGFALED